MHLMCENHTKDYNDSKDTIIYETSITTPHCTTPELASLVGMEKKRFLGNLYIRIGKKITTQSEKNTDTNRLRFRGTLFRYIYNTLAKGSYKPFYI